MQIFVFVFELSAKSRAPIELLHRIIYIWILLSSLLN